MFDFLKTFFQGLLYLILSPFILVGLVLYSVYAVILFLVMFVKRIIMFFRGEDMKDEKEIDRLAKLHLAMQDKELEEQAEMERAITPQPAPIIQNNTVVQPVIIQTDEDGKVKSVQVGNSIIQTSTTSVIEEIEETPTDIKEIETNEDEEL